MTRKTHRNAILVAGLLAAINVLHARADEPLADIDGWAPLDGPVEIRQPWPIRPIIAPGNPGEIFNPGEVHVCRSFASPEYRAILTQLAESVRSSIQCGDAEQAVESAARLEQVARQLVSGGTSAITGNCFSKKNCDRPKLTAGWVSQAECKTAGGDSWQQQNPTTGTCINL